MTDMPTCRWASGFRPIQLFRTTLIAAAVTACLYSSRCLGQSTSLAALDSPAALQQNTVPRLIKYSGILLDERGYPITVPVEVMFSFYDKQSPTQKTALWKETQRVSPNEKGQYTIYLGAASSQGLPPEAFNSVSAQWLGVAVEGDVEQQRTLLASVPYALKAGDAQTLGGLPVSAFAVAGSAASASNASPTITPKPLVTGTVTSVGLSAPTTDFNVSGSPVTSAGTLAFAWNTQPTSTNKASSIVKRDANGGFQAGLVNAAELEAQGSLTVFGTSYLGPANLSGPVGIGTVSPAALLNLNKNNQANADFLLIGNNSTKGLQLRDNGSGVDLESFGVPLYINFLTHQPTVINPNGGTVIVNDNKPTSYWTDTTALAVGSVVNDDDYAVSAIFEGKVNAASDVIVGGELLVDGSKDFSIDHPLDPTQKYLRHAAIESSEVLNEYSGNITTDELGQATVHLPDWFGVENIDFRYQLTVISGQFAKAVVAKKVVNNQFTIATNAPNVEVSWLLTARRNDPYMKAHPFVVEPEKPASKRGHYDHPELYGEQAAARR